MEDDIAQKRLALLFNAGRTAYDLNDLETGERTLREALQLSPGNPTVKAALGAVLLKSGRLAEGFANFDAWRDLPGHEQNSAPRLPITPWTGQPVSKKRILIWSEHGFGDQLMYARFAKVLVEHGADVCWLCPRDLARLFSGSLGIEVFPSDETVDLVGFDFYCPSSALPGGFGLTLESLPNAPYIKASLSRSTGGIGVMTEGNQNNHSGASRALPVNIVDRILGLPGAVNLDPRVSGARDFQDTAEIIAGLESIISVDTAVAHLAGSMGKLVHVLVPFVSDWRWMLRGESTPWYPSARLHRQSAPGDWRSAAEAAMAAI